MPCAARHKVRTIRTRSVPRPVMFRTLAEFPQEDLDGLLDEARRIAREMLAGRFADAGRAKPADRVQRALCGLSLLSIGEDPQDESDDGAAAEEPDE